jgi:hypothetical protein
MTLLAPADAIVAFASAGAFLLLLYVLKLRRRPLRVSTIAFWTRARADAQANEPFQRLRFTPLLVLHALIISLLALAAGRPVLNANPLDAYSRTVIIIDTSASMSAVDIAGKPPRIAAAKARAAALVDEVLAGASSRSVAIISAAAEASLASPFTSSTSLAAAAIDGITPTDQPGDINAAIKLAQTVASTSNEDDALGKARIILITDQVTSDDKGNTPLRASMPVTIEPVGASKPELAPLNRGITLLSARRDATDPSIVRIFIQITSNKRTSPPDRTDIVPITLTFRDQIITQRALTVDLADSTASGAAPGLASTTIELDNAGSGTVRAIIDEPDSLASDNSAAIVLDPPLRPSLMLVQPRPSPQGQSSARVLLDDVISELDVRTIKRVTLDEYINIAARNAFSDIDCIVFDRVSPAVAPPLPTLSFNADLPGTGVALSIAPDQAGGEVTLFWQRTHPLLASVSLDSLVIDDATVLKMTLPAGVSAEEVVSSRAGPIITTLSGGGPRRIIASFDLARSNWLLQPSFPIFLAESIRYLFHRADDSSGRSYLTTQPAYIRLKPGEPHGSVEITGPAALTLNAAASGLDSSGELAAGVLKLSGIYNVAGPGIADTSIAVNLLNATESFLKPVPIAVAAASPNPTRADAANAAENGQPLWPYVVAAAFALLCVEWLVFARDMRA